MNPTFVLPAGRHVRGFAAHCLVGLAALLGAFPVAADLLPASVRAVAGPVDMTQFAEPLIVNYTESAVMQQDGCTGSPPQGAGATPIDSEVSS